MYVTTVDLYFVAAGGMMVVTGGAFGTIGNSVVVVAARRRPGRIVGAMMRVTPGRMSAT